MYMDLTKTQYLLADIS